MYDPATDKNVDFLYTTTTNLVLSRYVGMRIIVTGEEGLAARWPDVPVLTIQRILVIDTNAVPVTNLPKPPGSGTTSLTAWTIAAQTLRDFSPPVSRN